MGLENTMKHLIPSLLATAALSALVMGCSEPAPTQEGAGVETASAEPTAPASNVDLDGLFAEYEQIHAALVRDDASQVAAAATRIHTQAQAIHSPALSARMAEVASAAQALSQADTSDLPAVRRAFGALSQPLVALLDENSELAANRHVFECPMAEGYGRWIQPSAELQNPYMGTAMPTCGQAVP
jgi:Cu(I)/Ag(I) efflux system membrane fusion protein